MAAEIDVVVAYAPAPRQVREIALRLAAGSTVAQALQASGLGSLYPELDLAHAPVGIWGRKAAREQVFRVRGLTKVYGTGTAEIHALDGVDLDLFAGELVVLLGPSGFGLRQVRRRVYGLCEAAPTGRTENCPLPACTSPRQILPEKIYCRPIKKCWPACIIPRL